MTDTIGYHLDLALTWAGIARGQHDYGDLTREADYLGKAHGHAFRAAELAYDLGQRQGSERVFGYVVRRMHGKQKRQRK